MDLGGEDLAEKLDSMHGTSVTDRSIFQCAPPTDLPTLSANQALLPSQYLNAFLTAMLPGFFTFACCILVCPG